MKNNILFYFFISILASQNISAQSENYAKFYNKGNKFIENNFEEAEKNFRAAIDDSLSDLRATFNLSNKYYSEGLYDEAISRQIESTKLAKNKSEKHKSFHNLGNSLMKKEMCSEAILAYKNALRNNPSDDETRYNLSLAKKCEEEQEQNKDDQQDKNDGNNKDDQNKDNQQDKNNKDDQQDKNDENNKDNQNKDDQQDQSDKNKDDQKKDNNKSDQPKENKNQQTKLSPQQIKNLLKAMENAEKKVQAKVNDKKQKGTKVVSEKDW